MELCLVQIVVNGFARNGIAKADFTVLLVVNETFTSTIVKGGLTAFGFELGKPKITHFRRAFQRHLRSVFGEDFIVLGRNHLILALYAAKACSYAQGMNLLRSSSNLRKWGINLGELARIWKGGCIIRAQFLGRIKEAYDRDPNLTNLLIDPGFRKELAERQDGWRSTVAQAVAAGIPLMAMGGALGYYDSLRRERLPANLTQAQRDYFGSHTYERLDKPGSFHTEWTAK